jgi:hypothetical protein
VATCAWHDPTEHAHITQETHAEHEEPKTICPKIIKMAVQELIRAIEGRRPFRGFRVLRRHLSKNKEQRDKLAEKVRKTIDKIESHTFRPKGLVNQPRGLHRLFHILPQHSFVTQYFPIDTQVRLSIVIPSMCWWCSAHGCHAVPGATGVVQDEVGG